MRKMVFWWLVLICAPLAAREYAISSPYEKQLRELFALWPGEYDNIEQVFFNPDIGVKGPTDGGHLRVHSFYTPLALPALGAHVLYVEEYKNDDPAAIFRQRIYVLSEDAAVGGIRIQLYSFKDKQKYVGTHANVAKLKDLSVEELSYFSAGCDLIARKIGAQFHAEMAPKACTAGEAYFNYQAVIGEGLFWFRDRVKKLSDDSTISEVANFTHHELTRVARFTCWAQFPRADMADQIDKIDGLTLHDGGGFVSFNAPDGRAFRLQMRVARWPYGVNRSSRTLYLYRGDEPKAFVYAWTEPRATRIGLNARELLVNCLQDGVEHPQR
jgi:hypothetical protein